MPGYPFAHWGQKGVGEKVSFPRVGERPKAELRTAGS